MIPTENPPHIFRLSGWLLLLAFASMPHALGGQNYLGIGFHLTPPVFLENTMNPYVVAKPKPGFAGSITFKKEWSYTAHKKWYAEAGLTTQGLRYYQINYFGDKETIWSDFINQHIGYPSILFGFGQSFEVLKRKGQLSLGLEGTILIAQDLQEIVSASYSIFNEPEKHAIFPAFFRLNVGYSHHWQMYKNLSGHIQLYAALSPQKITKGSQFIRNVVDGGPAVEGTYHVNNSELGIKFFTSLSKKQAKPRFQESNSPKIVSKPIKTKYRVSVTSHYFRPSPAIYHIPQIDSFSVKSREIALPQIGISLELPFRNHSLWSNIVHFGVGYRAATLVFKSVSGFASDGLPVAREIAFNDLGIYGICNFGISRRHLLKRQTLSQSLTFSMVIPLHKENTYLGIPQSGSGFQFPPYTDPILEGSVDYNYGRNAVLFGFEYNPEIIFKVGNVIYGAIGLVGNYSFGVISQGRFEVSNNTSTYHGAIIQNFSKIGISLRIGLEK